MTCKVLLLNPLYAMGIFMMVIFSLSYVCLPYLSNKVVHLLKAQRPQMVVGLLFLIVVGVGMKRMVHTVEAGCVVELPTLLVLQALMMVSILLAPLFGLSWRPGNLVTSNLRLGDLVFSDCLVSFAPIFAIFAHSFLINLHLWAKSNEETWGVDMYRREFHRYSAGYLPAAVALGVFPLALRALQCALALKATLKLEHLLNMVKYLVLMPAAPFMSTQFPILVGWTPNFLIAAQMYALYWDIFRDWKLHQLKPFGFGFVLSLVFNAGARFAGIFQPEIHSLWFIEPIRRAHWIPLRLDASFREGGREP